MQLLLTPDPSRVRQLTDPASKDRYPLSASTPPDAVRSATSTAESAGDAVLKATRFCRAKATSLPDCLCTASRRHVLTAHEYLYLRY
jgi:hypothetical protein